jgi:hypothetical protein
MEGLLSLLIAQVGMSKLVKVLGLGSITEAEPEAQSVTFWAKQTFDGDMMKWISFARLVK